MQVTDGPARTTIVMPTFQHERYLHLSTFSIMGQSVPVKLIVVPVKTDLPSIKLLGTMSHECNVCFAPSQMQWLASEKANVFDQMQIGLDHVDTEYFCVFGSDDFMLPNMVENLERHAEGFKHPIIGPSFAITDENLNIQSFHYNKSFKLRKQMKGSYIPDIALVRTEDARKVGGFTKADRNWGYLNHFAFYHRLLRLGNCEVRLLRDIGFLYRQLPKSRHNQRYKDSKDIRIHREKMHMIAKHYWSE